MKIETKLALNNLTKNKKRTLYTTISLILCTALILTTILLISSIRKGVSENFDTEYNDYHIILKDLSIERFNKIKNKDYIDKIYIQESENAPLQKVDASFEPDNNITVYLKYDSIQNVCEYSNDIISMLNLSEEEAREINNICKFNKQLLTVHGFIDVHITVGNKTIKCLMKLNYSYVIDLMIIAVIIVLSALFIVILYNAFLITINERKKEYAILNSVGGTEGQVLKMVFTEAILMGIVGIFIGGGLAILLAKIVINNVNSILNVAGYYFRIVFDIKYILFALFLISVNIYLSVLIPSVKASSTSVIQGIRNNKEIKDKKKNTVLEKILPIEGKVAIKNVKRNRSKYRLITFLLVVCITSFISFSTYISYEKETADIVNEYDVDAEMRINTQEISEETCKTILKDYEKNYGKSIDGMAYRFILGNSFLLVEPTNAILTEGLVFGLIGNKKAIQTKIIVLDNNTYSKYIDKLKAKPGDIIVYNNILNGMIGNSENEKSFSYDHAIDTNGNPKVSIINLTEDFPNEEKWNYKVTDPQHDYIFTDEMIEGFKEVKTEGIVTVFINMDTYKEIVKNIEEYVGIEEKQHVEDWYYGNVLDLCVKIKCDNIVEFKNYIEKTIENQNLNVWHIGVDYYTLENQEKIIYIDIIELILKVIMIAIVTIGIVSTINIINASLIERKEDFNILYRMGASKGNVKKILIYESIYMFVKAVIIAIILSIPIVYKIIKQMENILVLNKLLVPFGSIGIFIAMIFVISLMITIYSTKMIKEE